MTRKLVMILDTVFNGEMRPVFVDAPAVVLRRLKAGYPENWVKVCVGESGQIVTISEYLYGEKYQEVQNLLREVIKKHNLPIFVRDPSRLDTYISRVATQIIVLATKEK